MNKKELVLSYNALLVAIILHVCVCILLFFMQDTGQLSQPFENAPVVFDEAGEAGTARGTPEGTEIVKDSYEAQEIPATSAEEPAQETSEAETSEEVEEPIASPALPEAPTEVTPDRPALLQPYFAEATKGEPAPFGYAQPTQTQEPRAKPRRKRAAWHAIGSEARTRAAGLNISKHVRTFTDQQYDAYGTPDGTGGSADHGTGTGGGGNAYHHANINSLDLIKQSYMRKVVRAIVAQSNFMQLMTYSSTEIHKVTSWNIEISPDAKIKRMMCDETCSPSIDEGLRKIFYATQLPALPSRLKDGFMWQARITIHHPAQMAPLILTAVTD